MREISVPERGEANIPPEIWDALSTDDAFWALVDRKLLGVAHSGGRVPKLQAFGFVGRALIGNISINIVEKVPGALAALLGYAVGIDFRVERQETTASELGELVSLIVRHFVKLVREYASSGRQWEYVRTPKQGSLIGGRIQMTRTVSLRARGLRHVVAFDKNEASFRTDANRVIAGALAQVERIAKAVSIPGDTLVAARSLALMFSDCLDATTLLADRLKLAQLADELGDRQSNPALVDVLALAAVLLTHESFDRPSSLRRRLPVSWFLNLETMFESAIRRGIRRLLAPDYSVANGRRGAKPIFSSETDEFTANPDIVVRGRTRAIVGDAKYKIWTGTAGASDLHQLVVHAAAFASQEAFLVFPSDSFEVRDLGRAATDCQTWLFAVDVSAIDTSLRRVIESMGLNRAEEAKSA